MKYLDVIKKNRELGAALQAEKYNISILSNITMNQSKDVIELALREHSINADIEIGDYDAILQNSNQVNNAKAVIVFWEACNFVAGLQSKINIMSEEDIEELAKRVEAEINLLFRNLLNVPLVIINRFSSTLFDSTPLVASTLGRLCKRLNSVLENKAAHNQILVDLDAVIAQVSLSRAVDLRQFQSSKSLYTIEFFQAYAKSIEPAFLAAVGFSKKIIVLDCDNTLWAGILGEDGEAGIEMSDATLRGIAFQEVQTILRGLQKSGVLLALCSKNNLADVEKVFANHPDMILREDHLVCKKVNWLDKASNLREISLELSLGLESFIFLDDSDFELGLIQRELPQVLCIQVPKNLSEYPKLIRELTKKVFRLSKTVEDDRKTEMYHQENQRKKHAVEFESTEQYLASLSLKLSILWDKKIPVARVAQLSQKTNQLNLTTRRYTEADIQKMLGDPTCTLAAFSASDRYGDYGVTGVAIIRLNSEPNNSAEIDTLLMSCRVIARNLEYAFFDEIVRVMRKNSIHKLYGVYIATSKNMLVENLYDKLGMQLIESSGTTRNYLLDLQEFQPRNIDYIATDSDGG
jgi:FkbH-like protein